jgi:hypothetical protein
MTCSAVQAFATPVNNVTVTRAYLRASDAYALSTYREINAMVVAIDAQANAIAGQCPSVLTYAPRDEAFEELGEEASISLWSEAMTAVRSPALRFVGSIERLAWSNRRLTRLVHGEVVEERATVELRPPDLCIQIQAWKAGGYASLPPESSDFLRHTEAISSGSTIGLSEESRGAVIMRLLKPYEGSAERSLFKRIERLQTRIEKSVTAAVNVARMKLAATLGVSEL